MAEKEEEVMPEHMTPWHRNARLYEYLKSLGLHVNPVPFKDDRTKICWLQVSSQIPYETMEELDDCMRPSDSAALPVGLPVGGPKIADVIGAAVANPDDVIDFPAID